MSFNLFPLFRPSSICVVTRLSDSVSVCGVVLVCFTDSQLEDNKLRLTHIKGFQRPRCSVWMWVCALTIPPTHTHTHTQNTHIPSTSLQAFCHTFFFFFKVSSHSSRRLDTRTGANCLRGRQTFAVRGCPDCNIISLLHLSAAQWGGGKSGNT